MIEKLRNKIKYKECTLSAYKSKLAAAIVKGLDITLNKEDIVLYLGASYGTTSSFISKIVKAVFCIEISVDCMKRLLEVCEENKNMIPLLRDANEPESYKDIVKEVTFVYQDISQRNQVDIFIKNCNLFLKKGYSFLAVKSRSIDSVRNPNDIFKEVEDELKKHFKIIGKTRLEPFEKDHLVFLIEKV